MQIINELEKLFDLPCNWKSDLNLLKKYKVLEDLEEYISSTANFEDERFELKERIDDLEFQVWNLEGQIEELKEEM